MGLSARVLVAVEPELTEMMAALLRVAELQVVSTSILESEDGKRRPVAAVVGLSRDTDEAVEQAKQWIDRFRVRAVVAIEKAGANAKGVYHMVGGADISAEASKGTPVFAEAARQGILRIGIGDRGNELGLGPIAEISRGLLKFGRDCGCPCHGGVADETGADLAVPAVISNWGAYGIATCLAAIEGRPLLLHTGGMERRLLETAIREGGVDGMSGRAVLAVDGIGLETGIGIVELLAEIYRAQSVRDPSPFSTPLIALDPDDARPKNQ
jgi:hypothetical protein